MSKKILVLFAHPSQHRSEVNLPLVRACAEVDGVTVVDLYAEYPGYCIDIEREQQRLRDHDVIVFMFPIYWYSTPAILKEWQDLVLEYGFAYGHEGTALQGKLATCAITAGGPEHAYQSSGYNHYSIRELLRPLEQTTILCGMTYLPPFTLFGSRTAVEDGKVKQHVENWKRALAALRDNRLDLAAAATAETLNDCLDTHKRGQA
jgi:putative NADPH-quinone reductase